MSYRTRLENASVLEDVLKMFVNEPLQGEKKRKRKRLKQIIHKCKKTFY